MIPACSHSICHSKQEDSRGQWWERVPCSHSPQAVVHNCLHDKAHPEHPGRHLCPFCHESEMMHLLPFSGCSSFLMPSTVSIPRISLIEGDRGAPQFLHPLLLPLRAVKPTDGCHELAVLYCSSRGAWPPSACSLSAGTPSSSVTSSPHPLPCHSLFVSATEDTTLVTVKGGLNSFPSLALCFDKWFFL